MTFYEETNPADISLNTVKKLLREHFPKISNEEIRFFYHGTYNVFEVKNKFIFRFPDRVFYGKKGFQLIQREQEVLDLLRPYLPIEIPKYLYVSSDPENPYAGYNKVPGQSLSRCFHRTTAHLKKSIAKKVGEILSVLHSPEILHLFETKWKTDFTPEIYRQYWQDFFVEVQKTLHPLFTSAQIEWVDQLFTDFLEIDENFHFVPVVTHKDFDISNILVDPDSFEVTGVIDFEETNIYDPAADLLFFDEGQLFQNQVLKNYKGIQDSTLKERMKFLSKRSGLIYMKWGVDHQIPRMVDAGFEMLEKGMTANY
ncbi:MAG: phosphotransferase family protein [Promethearchaeota archaeon]